MHSLNEVTLNPKPVMYIPHCFLPKLFILPGTIFVEDGTEQGARYVPLFQAAKNLYGICLLVDQSFAYICYSFGSCLLGQNMYGCGPL